MKKLCIVLFFIVISFELKADLLKASTLLTPKQVIMIQLNALSKNDYPYKNFGIQQTWEFAHPNNRKFTGPLENFTKMMFSPAYSVMINHKSHKINELQITDDMAFYFIELINQNGTRFGFNWMLQKVKTEGNYFDCWMTTSVTIPMKYGEST